MHTSKPLMIALGGLSGSGKTTLAYLLARQLPNTIVLDSDMLRKRMHGQSPLEPLPDSAYHPQLAAGFIAYAHAAAARHMAAGQNVIVTGLFSDAQTRGNQKAAAENASGRFLGIYLDIPAKTLFQRVAARRNNPSDAHTGVLRRQLESRPALPAKAEGWHRLRADRNLHRLLKEAAAIIRHAEPAPAAARPAPPRP